MPYVPCPIDTSGVRLPRWILELAEHLAENAHEVWSAGRIAEGWRFGPERNDGEKLHPCLIPYSDLPESEKQYDRNAVLETLKALYGSGYCIVSATDEAAISAARKEAVDPDWLTRWAETIHHPDINPFFAHWLGRAHWSNADRRVFYSDLAQRLINIDEYLLAYDAANEGLEQLDAKDPRLRQLCGLALARSGATAEAHAMLEALHDEGIVDEETLGARARTLKDYWLQSRGSADEAARLDAAYRAYAEAYEKTKGYWTGINAASLARLRDDQEAARRHVEALSPDCHTEIAEFGEQNTKSYWALATLGEAALVLDDVKDAERWYRKAGAVGGKRYGDLHSSRKQAKLLLAHLDESPALADEWLPACEVVVFAGHMIDAPGRAEPRFPAELASPVQDLLREFLRDRGEFVAFSSAACGADILFLEVLRELGMSYHVVLPYAKQEFIGDSVAIDSEADWVARFEAVLADASKVYPVSPQRIASAGLSYEYANQVLLGLAMDRATQLGGTVTPLAVWNGRPGDGPGGTASIIGQWAAKQLPFHWIDLGALAREATQQHKEALIKRSDPAWFNRAFAGIPIPDNPDNDTEVCSMLFADAKGFGGLSDAQCRRFSDTFMGLVGKLTDQWNARIRTKNSWGDGLFVVFPEVADAGEFALTFADLVNHTAWETHGLPKGLTARIALHTGPVYHFTDAITKSRNVAGINVSRAARVEPITPPGLVYASEPFAALARFEQIDSFTSEYVGQRPLAKGYGTFPTYHVHWAGGPRRGP